MADGGCTKDGRLGGQTVGEWMGSGNGVCQGVDEWMRGDMTDGWQDVQMDGYISVATFVPSV